MGKTNILVVVDMQNDFIDGSLGTPEAEAIVANVVKKIKNFDGAVVYTQDTHQSDYLNTPEGQHLPIEHCIQGTTGWEISKTVMTALNKKGICFNIKKTTFGDIHYLFDIISRFGTNYNDLNIEIVGLCTDICVISNALILKAQFPAAEITVDASCCAGTSPSNHSAALQVMRACQINVVNETSVDGN